METLLAIAGGLLVATFMAVAVVTAVCVRALRRSNRVSPSVRSPAPLRWLGSPRRAPRLHRRLRRTVAAVRASTLADPASIGLAGLAADLERHACELDAQLVIADRSPAPSRIRMLRELEAEMAELDALATRVIQMSRAWTGAQPSMRGMAQVRERLDALDAALRELDGIERLPELPADRRHHRRLA